MCGSVKTTEFVKTLRDERRKLEREIKVLGRKVRQLAVVERSLRGLDLSEARGEPQHQMPKRRLSAAVRRRISATLKRRWVDRRKNGAKNRVKA